MTQQKMNMVLWNGCHSDGTVEVLRTMWDEGACPCEMHFDGEARSTRRQ